MGIGGNAQIFSRAGGRRWGLEQCFGEQIAPRVIRVLIAPELLEAAKNGNAAVGPCIPGRSETVQRIIGERLVPRVVFVVRNPKNVPVIAVAYVPLTIAEGVRPA